MGSYRKAQGTRSSFFGWNMMEDSMKKKYIYIWLGQFAVQQTLKKHCKSTLLWLKKKKLVGEQTHRSIDQNREPEIHSVNESLKKEQMQCGKGRKFLTNPLKQLDV